MYRHIKFIDPIIKQHHGHRYFRGICSRFIERRCKHYNLLAFTVAKINEAKGILPKMSEGKQKHPSQSEIKPPVEKPK